MLEPMIEIGRLQGTLYTAHAETHRRIDDLGRFLGGRMARLERRVDAMGGKGRRTSSPWLQIAAMSAIGFSALTGLVKPEVAAAILRGLLH